MTHNIPMYERIKSDILAKIINGEYATGTVLEPEPSLAIKYGASRTTMRQALTQLAAEGYIQRVKRRGTVVVDVKDHKRPGAWVAMVAGNLFGYPVQQTSEYIEKALKAKGLGLKVFTANNDLQEMEHIIKLAVEGGASGLLVCPGEDMAYSRQIRSLTQKGYPICLFDMPFYQLATDCAMTDSCEGGYLATAHLISLGHKRVAFAAAAQRYSTYTIGARYNGYIGALTDAGLDANPQLVIESRAGSPLWMEAMRDLLASQNRPSAIFAANYEVAVYILQVVSSLGLRVPDDLALVGFDNMDIVAHLATPLTTVEQPFHEMGTAAVRLLMERMEGKRTDISWTLLPPRLVVRRSCGA